MREDSLLCIVKRKFVVTTDSAHGLKVCLNRMVLTGPDQLWIAHRVTSAAGCGETPIEQPRARHIAFEREENPYCPDGPDCPLGWYKWALCV